MTQPNYVLAGPHCDPPADWMYWVIEGQLLAGPYPGSSDSQEHRTKVQALADARITTMINFMEESELLRFTPYEATVRELAVEQVLFLKFPIRDVNVPTPELMASILDAIDESLRQERPVSLVNPILMLHRQTVEYLPTMFPVGHELIHHRLKSGIVGRLVDMNHLVDDDVFEALARLSREIGV